MTPRIPGEVLVGRYREQDLCSRPHPVLSYRCKLLKGHTGPCVTPALLMWDTNTDKPKAQAKAKGVAT